MYFSGDSPGNLNTELTPESFWRESPSMIKIDLNYTDGSAL